MMKTMKIPSSAIIDLSTDAPISHATHDTGDVIVFLDKISYMRNTYNNAGLLRMVTGVDITVKKEWYDKVVEAIN